MQSFIKMDLISTGNKRIIQYAMLYYGFYVFIPYKEG